MIRTERALLRPFHPSDLPAFAAMCADPEVMWDLGGPLGQDKSEAKMAGYVATHERLGFSRWVIEDGNGFAGYAGIMPTAADVPLAPGFNVGWRLVRAAWSKGLASEAAAAVLRDAFERTDTKEITSYTAPDNVRSQRVMERLGLRRAPDRDFTTRSEGVEWRGMVWVAVRGQWWQLLGKGALPP